MDRTTLRPSEIRFKQDSIKYSFQDGRSVNVVAEDVCSGRTTVNEFPVIQVIKWNNKYYSFDNRRLYVFRVAEYRGVVTRIPVKIVPESRLDLNTFTTENDGRTVQVRGGRTLPHCKDQWLRIQHQTEGHLNNWTSSPGSTSTTRSHNNTPEKVTALPSRTTTRNDYYPTAQRPPRHEVTPAVEQEIASPSSRTTTRNNYYSAPPQPPRYETTPIVDPYMAPAAPRTVWNPPRQNIYRDANPVYIDIPDDPEEDGGYFGSGFKIPKWCICLCVLCFILSLFDRSDHK